METDNDGIKLIEEFEGCRLTAYVDSGGIPTIGYGHTDGVYLGMTITHAQADAFLAQDLRTSERFVNLYVTVPVNQHQFDALISFTYNLGPGTLFHSQLLTYLNCGDIQSAADEFLEYDHAGGVRVAGLTRRREAERLLFLTPYGDAVKPKTSFAHRLANYFGAWL